MFNIKGDLKPITKGLKKLQKKQIPFASAMAINSTLFDIRKAEMVQAQKKLDRPTPFTVKGFRVRKAKKTMLHGEVYISPQVWSYLKYQVDGGTRIGKTGVPYIKNAKLNKYGNIPNRRAGLIKNKNQIISTINGTTGVWERGHISKKGKFTSAGKSRSTNLRLMVAFENNVKYTKRFPFFKIADGVARSMFQRNFKRELNKAMRSAK